ncbi:condensation domain-containing protein [Luteimonas aquatica]|uniref:condensation domain-containing protein n=1 Tax=Luteimonas aquatica TaxID=450364 RepID=UPI001F59435A|nr:condensation domain-containing protein [Luteimonas aquatica]
MSQATHDAARRPLTLFERGMYLDGRVPVAIVFPAHIAGRLDETRLRRALAGLQAKHRLLRCLIVQREGRPWFETQAIAPPIPLRVLAREDAQHWLREGRREETRLFDGAHEPLVRLTWLRGEARSDLLLVCHHCLCDGRSIVTLLRELLLLHDAPDRDLGRDDSLHALAELLPDTVTRDRGLQRRLRWLAALFRACIRLLPAGRPRVYGETYTLRWTLEGVPLQALSRRCEVEGVTLFGALSVAFVLAFRAAGHGGRFSVPVDARRFLPGLGADQLFAIAPTLSLSLDTPAGGGVDEAGFWHLARTLKADLRERIARLGPKTRQRLLGMEHLHGVFDKMLALSRSRPAGRDVTLSYLGRLDLAREYDGFRLEAVRTPSAALAPTPATLVIAGGFADCLDFSLVSDARSLPQARAQAVRERAMAILHACARLPETPSDPMPAAAPAAVEAAA